MLGSPVAAFLPCGRLGADETGADGLGDPLIRALGSRLRLVEGHGFGVRFPAERFAGVAFAPMPARHDPEAPLSDDEIGERVRVPRPRPPRARRAAVEAAAGLPRS